MDLDDNLKKFEDDLEEFKYELNAHQNIIWGKYVREFLESTNISQSDLQDFESIFKNLRIYSGVDEHYDTMKTFIKLLRRKNLKFLSKN